MADKNETTSTKKGDGLVQVTISGHIDLDIDGETKSFQPGDKVRVTRERARGLRGAGYATRDDT